MVSVCRCDFQFSSDCRSDRSSDTNSMLYLFSPYLAGSLPLLFFGRNGISYCLRCHEREPLRGCFLGRPLRLGGKNTSRDFSGSSSRISAALVATSFQSAFVNLDTGLPSFSSAYSIKEGCCIVAPFRVALEREAAPAGQGCPGFRPVGLGAVNGYAVLCSLKPIGTTFAVPSIETSTAAHCSRACRRSSK